MGGEGERVTLLPSPTSISVVLNIRRECVANTGWWLQPVVYRAITNDRERVNEAIRFSNALSGLNETFGPIIESEVDAQAWSESQPDEPHQSLIDDKEETETRTI